MRPKVAGRCPACGSDGTLFVADGDYITCSLDKCPDPTLVTDFLDKQNGPDIHVAEFTRDGWHLEHTMRCRLDGMANCLIHRALTRLDDQPHEDRALPRRDGVGPTVLRRGEAVMAGDGTNEVVNSDAFNRLASYEKMQAEANRRGADVGRCRRVQRLRVGRID